MHYKVSQIIGFEAESLAWQKIEGKEIIELSNASERIFIKIKDDIAKVEIIGDGSVVLQRDNKSARLANRSEGKVKSGDKIWLLNQDALKEFKNGLRDNFRGAAIKIEMQDEVVERKHEIYVKERVFSQERGNKSTNLILGLVVFTLLAVGTFLGYQKRNNDEGKEKYDLIKNGVDEKIKEIESVRTVNIETALELAQNAEALVINSGVAEKKYASELAELRKKINEVKKSLGGESLEHEIAYDTALIKEGDGVFKGIVVKDGICYLWSASLGQINSVNLNLKSTEKIVSDERIKLWLGIFNNGEKWYGYDQNKIYEIKRNELVETEIKNVTSIGEMTGWNGLIYVLDNGSQSIVKLTEGQGKNWLKEGTNLSEEATSMSIDSNIWVLGKSGKIYKYIRGLEEKFEMSTLSNSNSAKYLRTEDKINFLAYVTNENMVVIYGKDGKILSKYNFANTKIADIGIESQNKAVLVLANNGKIYRIKIQ